MKRSGLTALAAITTISLMAASSAAVAQYVYGLGSPIAPGAAGPPQPRPERPDERTPAARQAEDYTAKGVPIGGFDLFLNLEAVEQFNDNIYATSAATGTVAAFVQQVNPSLNLKSNWNNHMLNFYATAGFGFYSIDSAANNYQDVSVGADGRLDIQRNWNIYGGASWNREHIAQGQPNSPTAPGTPIIVYNRTSANAGYFQKFNRLSVRADARFDNLNYLDNFSTAPGFIPNSSANHNEWRESLRLGYEFIDGSEFWVRGSLNQRPYFQLDSSGLDRSSNGFDVVGGILIDLGGITAVELFGGYLQQNFVSGQFSTISTPTFGLAGYWNPIHELWVRPYVRRTVYDSLPASSAAFLATSAGVNASYLLVPNVQLDGLFDYSIADYAAVSGGSSTQYDQYFTFRVGALYFPTSNFYVGPTYQFVHRTSNQFNADYNQNLVMLRLGARL